MNIQNVRLQVDDGQRRAIDEALFNSKLMAFMAFLTGFGFAWGM